MEREIYETKSTGFVIGKFRQTLRRGFQMGSLKVIAYIAMAIAFAGYATWLANEKRKGRGTGIWHKDISGFLWIAWASYMIYLFM